MNRFLIPLLAAVSVGCGNVAPAPPSGGWHSRMFAVGEGDSLHVVHKGLDRGRVLVFLPGLADTWASFQDLTAAIPDSFGMILVDALGHGGSTKRQGSNGPGRQSRALRAALDSLGVQPYAVIGHSFGGLIAQHYGLRHPELPAAVLIATAATLQGTADAETWAAFGRSLPDTVPDDVLAGQAQSFHGEVPDSVVRPFIEASKRTPGHVWREVIGVLVSEDTRGQLAAWKPRTLLIIPEQDKVLGAAPMQTLADAMPGAEVARIPRTSHAPHWQRADTVGRVITDFLSRIGSR